MFGTNTVIVVMIAHIFYFQVKRIPLMINTLLNLMVSVVMVRLVRFIHAVLRVNLSLMRKFNLNFRAVPCIIRIQTRMRFQRAAAVDQMYLLETDICPCVLNTEVLVVQPRGAITAMLRCGVRNV